MESGNDPSELSIIIPSSPTSVQTATETAVDEPYSQLDYQPYWSPVSPLKHPYRPRTVTSSRTGTMPKLELNLKAEDVTSPDLLAVANLMSAMKETLNRMTRTFNALGDQAQRLSSLPSEIRRAEEESYPFVRALKVELEEQIARQRARVQELRRRLEGGVRTALEKKLRNRLASIIQECVANEVEERVRQEIAAQAPPQFHKEPEPNPGEIEQLAQREAEYQSDPDTPLLSPEDLQVEPFPRIPILLFHGATDDEEGCLHSDLDEVKTELNSPLFSREHDSYPPVKLPILLFDESQEHEPPPPSPIPVAGPLRPLLRPLPTPEQSPAYVVHDILPSRCASGCATPMTACPGVPAPTPVTNEPIIMVYPLRSAPVSALSPVSEVASPLAPRDLNLLFALSSKNNREMLRSKDVDNFVVPTPMAEWPKTRTIIKTPARSMRSSPLMVPPPVEPQFVTTTEQNDRRIDDSFLPEVPTLLAPPPRPELRARSTSFVNNLKLLPPLIID